MQFEFFDKFAINFNGESSSLQQVQKKEYCDWFQFRLELEWMAGDPPSIIGV